MREIKFRGLRVNGNDWTFGQIYKHEPPLVCFGGDRENPKYFILSTGSADWNMPRPINQHEVFEDSVGQCTGLQDKNGVDIYEGDLIQLLGNKNGSLLVEFKNQYVGGWVLTYKGEELSLGARKREELLVIGNIYENETIQNIL